jgi:hypothetical protein
MAQSSISKNSLVVDQSQQPPAPPLLRLANELRCGYQEHGNSCQTVTESVSIIQIQRLTASLDFLSLFQAQPRISPKHCDDTDQFLLLLSCHFLLIPLPAS